MSFDSLTEILRQLAARHPGLAKGLKEAQAFTRWEGAVGPAIAKYARPVSVKNRVLFVVVDHPIWRSELHHRKQQILERLNLTSQREGAEVPLKDIVFLDPSRKEGVRNWVGARKKGKSFIPPKDIP